MAPIHRDLWIGTSWKMNKSLAESVQFAQKLLDNESGRDHRIQRFVIPAFTSVREVKSLLRDSSVKVGAQNMHWENAGAWTGEISPVMLTDCELDLVELGHSERRTHFGETDETVGKKVASALQHGLIPLICVGETLEEKNAGKAEDRLSEQVIGALQFISALPDTSVPVMFAYEPVWAIGDGGTPASADYADRQQERIIALASEKLGITVPCLYGGSVNKNNCQELIQQQHINGLFIGRSAWQVEGYLDILRLCSECT